MASDNYFDNLIKILLIGNSGVGKSSLLFRLCENDFPLAFRTATKGITCKTKNLMRRDKRVKLQIWVIKVPILRHVIISKIYFDILEVCQLRLYSVANRMFLEKNAIGHWPLLTSVERWVFYSFTMFRMRQASLLWKIGIFYRFRALVYRLFYYYQWILI